MVNKLIYLIVFLSAFYSNAIAQDIKRDSHFDTEWKFYRGKLVGAENPNYDDKTWRDVTIPHDWSIEDLPTGQLGLPVTVKPQSAAGKPHIISGPFDSEAICGFSTGYTIGGTGWYRKHFLFPQ